MRTYDVTWTRPQDPGEQFTCTGLTAVQLARRLVGAVENFGQVTIVGVETDGGDDS